MSGIPDVEIEKAFKNTTINPDWNHGAQYYEEGVRWAERFYIEAIQRIIDGEHHESAKLAEIRARLQGAEYPAIGTFITATIKNGEARQGWVVCENPLSILLSDDIYRCTKFHAIVKNPSQFGDTFASRISEFVDSRNRWKNRAEQAEADAEKACRILIWGSESEEDKIRRAIEVLDRHYQPEPQGEDGDKSPEQDKSSEHDTAEQAGEGLRKKIRLVIESWKKHNETELRIPWRIMVPMSADIADQVQADAQPGQEAVGEWITWPGGECPVHPDTAVVMQQRDGETFSGDADDFLWRHDGMDGDIVAYKVLKEMPAPKDPPQPPGHNPVA